MKVRLSLFAVFEISWQNVCEVQVSQAMIMKFRFLRQLFVFFLHNPFFWKLALRHALDNSEMASTPLSCIPFETYHHHFQLLRIIITRSRKTASEMHVTPWIWHTATSGQLLSQTSGNLWVFMSEIYQLLGHLWSWQDVCSSCVLWRNSISF